MVYFILFFIYSALVTSLIFYFFESIEDHLSTGNPQKSIMYLPTFGYVGI